MSLLFVVIAVIAQVSAGDPGTAIRVQAAVSHDSVRIGEPLTLTVTVSGLGGAAEVAFPLLADSGAITALGPPSVAVDHDERSARYELAAWEFGDLTLPQADVRVVTDAAELRIPLPGVALHVVSALPADADVDTLAWKPPADVLGPNWSTGEKLAALGLALAFALATFLYARRRGEVQPVPVPPPRSARAVALEALERLEASGMIEAGELKGFFSTLSHILREFLAGTDRAWSLDLTTAELMALVGMDGVPETQVRSLGGLLDRADMVKFARQRPTRAQAGRALDAARHWLTSFERVVPELEPLEPEAESGEEALELEFEALTDLDKMFSEETATAEAEAQESEEP
ncbi:MAG: hypothetical protein GTO46_07795 [Gemmatimonadetes bacterium]|nr:hypothetical protein [Gemmatimonadota bacterium]NIO31530.1 hypothetical protein [Gemmatimonadota bacterium]